MNTDLPDLYARVCAKRPELGFVYLRHDGACWTTGKTVYCDSTAAALILARWVDALPIHVSMQRTFNKEWCVSSWCGEDEFEHFGPTPIEALAAFYLGQESA